jgi:hypothetical protein
MKRFRLFATVQVQVFLRGLAILGIELIIR